MDSESPDLTEHLLVFLIPLIIFFVLIVHEWGHYLAARFFRVPIDEVVIGAGKTIWKNKARKKTRWSVRLYPFWAHVQISGTMSALPVWKKFAIVLAGPAFNLILPFCLLSAFFVFFGQPATPSILTGVEIDGVAAQAGLEPGDEILSVNEIPVQRYAEVRKLAYKEGKQSLLEVRRDGQIIKIIVQPYVLQFKDTEGIKRKHPRLGVLWHHKAVNLKIVHAVNGIDTKDQKDKARELIVNGFGRETILGLDSNDKKIHHYKTLIRRESNPGLSDPDHEEYEKVFLGITRDDFYYQTSFFENIKAAMLMNGQLIKKVIGLPFQLLPVDPEVLTPEYYVQGDETWLRNKAYKIIYVVCLASLLMAFINLLPLPRLDGSLLLFYMTESVFRKTLSSRQKALMLGLFFMALYACILITNLDNMPGYIDSRLKKLQEFIDNENTEE